MPETDRLARRAAICLSATAIALLAGACTQGDTPSGAASPVGLATPSVMSGHVPEPVATTDPGPDSAIVPTGPDSTVAPRDSFWERRLIRTFRSLGAVDVGVVQHEFQSARVGGSWRDVYVTVYETSTQQRSTPGQLLERIDLGVTTGSVIRTVSGPFVRYSCQSRRYHVAVWPSASATHSQRQGVEKFIRALLPLTCSSK